MKEPGGALTVASQKLQPTKDSNNLGNSFFQFALKIPEWVRNATYFAKVTSAQINTIVGDSFYELASINTSLGSLAKLSKGANIFNLAASVTSTFACGVAFLDKAAKAVHVSHLQNKLRGCSDKQEKAQLMFKIDEMKKDIGSNKWSLTLSAIASVSFLIGSIGSVVAKTPGWVSPTFGSIAFGVAYAAAKIVDLKADFKQAREIGKQIKKYKELATKAVSPNKEIYNMKAAALENYLDKYNKWRVVENTIDVLVGVTAVVAGVTLLAGASAVSFGVVPLAVALGASITFKLGLVAYQNLKDPESREKAKCAIKLAALQVYTMLPGVNKANWKSVLQAANNDYNEAKAKELTKNSDPTGSVKNFVNQGEEEIKKMIAAELGLFNAEGNPDPSQVKKDEVYRWLIST